MSGARPLQGDDEVAVDVERQVDDDLQEALGGGPRQRLSSEPDHIRASKGFQVGERAVDQRQPLDHDVAIDPGGRHRARRSSSSVRKRAVSRRWPSAAI